MRKGRRRTARGGKFTDLFTWGSEPVQPVLPVVNPAPIQPVLPVAGELVRQPNLNGGPMMRLKDEIDATEEMVKSACAECDAMKEILAGKKKEYAAQRKALNAVLGPALNKAAIAEKARNNSNIASFGNILSLNYPNENSPLSVAALGKSATTRKLSLKERIDAANAKRIKNGLARRAAAAARSASKAFFTNPRRTISPYARR